MMSRVAPITLVALVLSACASGLAQTSKDSPARRSRFPTTDDLMASCMPKAHQLLWSIGLMQDFEKAITAVDDADLPEETKTRLKEAYSEKLREEGTKSPPRIGERPPEPTPEQIAIEREQLARFRERQKRGESESLRDFVLESLFPDEEERRLVKLGIMPPRTLKGPSPEILEKVAREYCEERTIAFIENFAREMRPVFEEWSGRQDTPSPRPFFLPPTSLPGETPYQQPALKYNPFDRRWTYEDPRSRLHFNPFQNRWEYGHPQAQPRFNPFSGEWEVK